MNSISGTKKGKNRELTVKINSFLPVGICLLVFPFISYSQKFFEYDKNNISAISVIAPSSVTGPVLSFSLTGMFTSGSIVQDGFRWGGGISGGYNWKYVRISTGMDFYKALEKFGKGTAFAGISYGSADYNVEYFWNKYFQEDKQISGLIRIRIKDFSLSFEDDILALPFTGFVLYDRFRTAAIELEYKYFILGTNVYTNEANGLTNRSAGNKQGVYYQGQQRSSPMYAGYRNKGWIIRTGINHPFGGYTGQNWWHQAFFGTTDYQSGDYRKFFLQTGLDKPYTLY